MNENKKVLTEEEKNKLSHLFAAMVPNGTLSPEDILWLMNEIENGNKNVSFDDFMKAKKERDNHKTCETCRHYTIPYTIDDIDFPCRLCTAHSKWEPEEEKKEESPHFCFRCKHQTCDANEEPCISCNEWPHSGYLNMTSKWEPKEEKKETHFCKDCKFAENPVFKEPCSSCFKIDNNGNDMYHQNWQPKPDKPEEKEDIPQPDDIELKVNSIRNNSGHIRATTERIEDKIDKLTEALESVNSKLDILDQRMHDLRQHQILKGMKYVTQVKDTEKDIFEKLKIKDEDVCKDCNYYGMCSGYEGDMIYCKNFKKKDISSAKEPPKFKVGDIVKVTNDSKNKDFFICRIKWSERSKRWNYLISLDLEDISGAFWRMEDFLIKSEDHSEPLFKVGDTVRLKNGKTIYTVHSIGYFITHDDKIVYRYKIGHNATTPHYENENRLIKA